MFFFQILFSVQQKRIMSSNIIDTIWSVNPTIYHIFESSTKPFIYCLRCSFYNKYRKKHSEKYLTSFIRLHLVMYVNNFTVKSYRIVYHNSSTEVSKYSQGALAWCVIEDKTNTQYKQHSAGGGSPSNQSTLGNYRLSTKANCVGQTPKSWYTATTV